MKNSQQINMRLAPTPSGFLHQGNAVNFILNWVICRLLKGRLRLRIDDLDRARFRVEYLEDIFKTLEWLQIDIDDGPSGVDDFEQHYAQALRIDQYRSALNKLEEKGLLYHCTCSRKKVKQESIDGFYSGHCKNKGRAYQKGETKSRVNILANSTTAIKTFTGNFRAFGNGSENPAQPSTEIHHIDLNQHLDDFVVWKKDDLPSYQLASLVDDHLYNINFIVRGKDLLASTYSQLYLDQQIVLNHLSAATFWHHPLIVDTNGAKLSKSAGAVSIKSWRNNNQSPEPLFDQAAQWLGFENARQLDQYLPLPI